MVGGKGKTLAWVVLLVSSATLFVMSSAQPRGAAAGTVTPTPSPGGSAAATNLAAEVDCDPVERDHGIARLHWTVADPPGQEQIVQVTIFRDGFDTEHFVSSRPLPPTQNAYTFEQVSGQAVHRWRVLTRRSDTLIPSETARFTGPLCVFDEELPEPPDDGGPSGIK